MDALSIILTTVFSSSGEVGVLGWILKGRIVNAIKYEYDVKLENIKGEIQKENTEQLEKLRWELKVREQAHKVAKYMAEAYFLDEKKIQRRRIC